MDRHHISASEFVKQYRSGGLNQAKVIDVREPYEWDMYHLDQALHMPMNTIPMNLDQLPMEEELFIVCAHGVRSWYVVNYLLQNGFNKVINVEGGMAEIQMILDTVEEE